MPGNTKEAREVYARDQAAHLSHIAMRLQRCSKKSIPGLLREADVTLARYKMAKFLHSEPTGEVIQERIVEDLEAPMNALSEVIMDVVAPFGFALLVFSQDPKDPRTNYVSNCNRDDICEAMREFVTVHEASKA